MGYSTDFYGVLEFTTPLTSEQEQELLTLSGEDIREHRDWVEGTEFDTDEHKWLSYIDLQITTDKTGLEWTGSEKTYDLVEKVNLVLLLMQKKWPNFGLRGSLTAQGENSDDRWILNIGDDGRAEYVGTTTVADNERLRCPHCKASFLITEAGK